MDKISTIKKNILLFIENQGFKKEDFFNKVGISYSNFKGKSLNSEIAADKLVTILTIFPQLNSEWLLTGNGEMLKHYDLTTEEINNAFHSVNEPQENYGTSIDILKDYNVHLKKEVEELKKDKSLLQLIIESKLINH